MPWVAITHNQVPALTGSDFLINLPLLILGFAAIHADESGNTHLLFITKLYRDCSSCQEWFSLLITLGLAEERHFFQYHLLFIGTKSLTPERAI